MVTKKRLFQATLLSLLVSLATSGAAKAEQTEKRVDRRSRSPGPQEGHGKGDAEGIGRELVVSGLHGMGWCCEQLGEGRRLEKADLVPEWIRLSPNAWWETGRIPIRGSFYGPRARRCQRIRKVAR